MKIFRNEYLEIKFPKKQNRKKILILWLVLLECCLIQIFLSSNHDDILFSFPLERYLFQLFYLDYHFSQINFACGVRWGGSRISFSHLINGLLLTEKIIPSQMNCSGAFVINLVIVCLGFFYTLQSITVVYVSLVTKYHTVLMSGLYVLQLYSS